MTWPVIVLIIVVLGAVLFWATLAHIAVRGPRTEIPDAGFGTSLDVHEAAQPVPMKILLAIDGLQNIPEGLAIAMPIRRDGMGTGRAFFWGQLSAAVEPVAGVIGAALALASATFLPLGWRWPRAPCCTSVEELIPETVRSGSIDIATLGFLGGFIVMMALDNALG